MSGSAPGQPGRPEQPVAGDHPEQPDALGERSRLARAATAQEFSLAAAVGSPRDVVESALPTLAFVVVYTFTSDLRLSVTIALAAAGVSLVVRALTRRPLAPAVAGAVVVGICALLASRTGRAENFYVPGLVINAVYAAVLALSAVSWPRVGAWPVVGLVVGPLSAGARWRADVRRMRVYRRLTLAFAGMFAVRLAVQLPLFWAGEVAVLGIVKLVMGIPLTALFVWLAWATLRRTPPQVVEPPDQL